jgi:hypothetical protein
MRAWTCRRFSFASGHSWTRRAGSFRNADSTSRSAQEQSVGAVINQSPAARAAHDLLVELLRSAGVQGIEDETLPNTNPIMTGSTYDEP